MNQVIDFDSRIPYYVQLIDSLRNEIEQGSWRPGQRLPGEHELCDLYGISRTVVRQALRELEMEGIIYRRKGKGSFVSEPKMSEGLAQKLVGFYQDMVERGLTPESQVLALDTEQAGNKVAEYLAIQPGTPVTKLERLRSVQGEPRLLVSSYLPQALCPGLERFDFSDRSLYATLEEHYDLAVARGRRFIEATVADEREALLLRVEVGSPLLLVNSVSYGEDGAPIEYYHAVHRGDRSRFEVELVRIQEQGQVRKPIGTSGLDLPASNPFVRSKQAS